MEHAERAKLGVISFGLALGFTWALIVFGIGLTSAFLGWGMAIGQVLGSLYVGFSPTFIGCIAGAVWAFATAFVVGAVMAVLYNFFLRLRR